MKKYLLHLVATLICIAMTAPAATGQRQRNYIYLFDCTQSMQTLGIWDAAKTALDRTVGVQLAVPEAQFSVIPFQGKNHPAFAFDAESYAKTKGEMFGKFDEYIKARTNTSIYDALNEAFSRCRPEMDNRVYLLTDGTDNVRKTPAVVDLINRWCASHNNTRLFYVTLDDAAVDPDIRAAIDACRDAFMVNCHNGVIPQIADYTTTTLYANTLELPADRRLNFSEPGSYDLTARCADPFFDVTLPSGGARDQIVDVRISMRQPMSIEELNSALDGYTDTEGNYEFEFEVVPANADALSIVNPRVTVVMSNRRQRMAELRALAGPGGETRINPEATSYPAFLWSPAKRADALVVNLDAVFNDAARDAGSAVAFKVVPAHGEADYTLLFNDEPVGTDSTITLHAGMPAQLAVQFDDEAATGKRYIVLDICGKREVDLLDGCPPEEYQAQTLRLRYDREWNPLATIFFWAGIVLLAAMVLWFAVLRRIFYPKFRVGAIEVTGPGSYYVRKRVRPYRRVCFTSRAMSQSFVSKIFTGKILYVRDTVWSPALTLEPGNKQTVRALAQKGWDIVPSRTMRRHDTYELINTVSGDKAKITIQ